MNPPESRRPDTYSPAKALTGWLVGVLAATAVFGVLATALDVTSLLAYPELNDPAAELEGAGVVILALGFMAAAAGGIALFVASVVLFCMWAHRANRNARALGSAWMEFTPAWTVGWFFIPIANLFKPYQAIKEIYRASDPALDADEWPGSTVPGYVPTWWGVWILSNILGNQEMRLAWKGDPASMELSTWVGIAATAASVVATYLVIRLIRDVGRRQAEKHQLQASATR